MNAKRSSRKPRTNQGASTPKPAAPKPKLSGQGTGSGGRRRGNRRRRSDNLETRFKKILANFPPAPEHVKDQIKLFQRGRDAAADGKFSLLNPEEITYMIISGIELLAEDELDRIFDHKYRAQLHEIRVQRGVEPHHYWDPDGLEAPPDEYVDLLEAFRQEKRTVLASWFEKHSETELAQLVQTDYGAYCSRRSDGKQALLDRHFGEQPYGLWEDHDLTDSEEDSPPASEEDGDQPVPQPETSSQPE